MRGRALPGSERDPAPDVVLAQPLDPATRITVTLLLRHRPGAAIGADPADVATVTSELGTAGLQIDLADVPSRRVRASGTAERLADLFGAELAQVTGRAPGGETLTHRQCTSALYVPESLSEIVVAILGLDDRPQARAHFRVAADPDAATGFTPPQLGTIYHFPDGTDGRGQRIAIIELGGGYTQSDLDSYFAGLGLSTPSVTAVGVDGAANSPTGDPRGPDGEVALDIDVVGALAPAAAQMVYFAPNTDAGFVDALSEAIHASTTPVAISISWGQREDTWAAQARTALDSVLADAATLGITVCVAAGDNGSSDGASDGRNHVDFPASSPHALGCGGTTLHADPADGTVTSETVWNDGANGGATGGGVSDVFARPEWQANAGVPGTGRGVPDVAGDADPQTGYHVTVDGQAQVFGGTSAVAPLWAALVARLVQASGARVGLAARAFYGSAAPGQPTPGLRDITSGDNGAYSAGPGWDACTGLGTPEGAELLTTLPTG